MNKDPFTKKKKKPCQLSFICHISDLWTYFGGWAILVSVQDIFWEFLFKLVWTGFCSASKQPIPSDKKKYCCYHHQEFWTKNFFFSGYVDVDRAEGHTAVDISVKQSWKKLYLQILMRETCLSFFNIEEFYQSYNFGCFWWI
jgi:hypothetical protein